MIAVLLPAVIVLLMVFFYVIFAPGAFDPRARGEGPQACEHAETVPVNSLVTGELLARLCVRCGEQLDVSFVPAAECKRLQKELEYLDQRIRTLLVVRNGRGNPEILQLRFQRHAIWQQLSDLAGHWDEVSRAAGPGRREALRRLRDQR